MKEMLNTFLIWDESLLPVQRLSASKRHRIAKYISRFEWNAYGGSKFECDPK
jgi:hypothetical protein